MKTRSNKAVLRRPTVTEHPTAGGGSDWQQVSVKPPKVEKAAARIEKLWVKP